MKQSDIMIADNSDKTKIFIVAENLREYTVCCSQKPKQWMELRLYKMASILKNYPWDLSNIEALALICYETESMKLK